MRNAERVQSVDKQWRDYLIPANSIYSDVNTNVTVRNVPAPAVFPYSDEHPEYAKSFDIGDDFNDGIPKQFHYPEYKELDRHLTQRFGLPFTYKRFQPESYHYIPYGYDYTYLAEPTHFCSNDTFMVVMIMSTVKKPEERTALRSSWFKDKTVLGEDQVFVHRIQ